VIAHVPSKSVKTTALLLGAIFFLLKRNLSVYSLSYRSLRIGKEMRMRMVRIREERGETGPSYISRRGKGSRVGRGRKGSRGNSSEGVGWRETLQPSN